VEDFLAKFIGKTIDIYCGGASSLRGEVLKVEMGVLHLRDMEAKRSWWSGKLETTNTAPDSCHKKISHKKHKRHKNDQANRFCAFCAFLWLSL
jgi:hypothetical protein